MALQPIIEDQYTAARAYFLCVIGILLFESCVQFPSHLTAFRRRNGPSARPSGTHSTLYSFSHKILTLPSPVPFLTSHGIPNLLRLGVFVGLNILWGWNRNKYTGDFRLYGWLTIANGGLALLMAARNNAFSIIARIPSPTLLLYHRWIGRATFVHATLHFGFNTRRYIQTNQLTSAYSNTRIQIGLVAWLSLCVIFLTSISLVRRRWFEAFYYPHFLFIIFVIGACIHASRGPEFLLPGLGLWVVDRIIRFVQNFQTVRVTSAAQYPGDLTKFKIEGLRTSHANQITWIQIPKVSFLNWHPFTIISAPGDKHAVLAIRGLGNYTKALQSIISETKVEHQEKYPEDAGSPDKSIIKVRLDGPYGLGDSYYDTQPVTVLVAGGIGITPGMSIMMSIIKKAKNSSSPVRDGQWQHIHLLWSIKDAAHAEWFRDELNELALAASDPRVPVTLDVRIHVTGSVSSNDTSRRLEMQASPSESVRYKGPGMIIQGRPNMVQYLNEVNNVRRGVDVAVHACGPRSMIADVRKAAAKASRDGNVVSVHEEVFEL